MVAKRPPPRLGRLLRRGGAPPGFGRASVFTPTGGLTARPTAAAAQVRLGSQAAEPQPPYGVIRPHLPWIRGAPAARTRVAGRCARDNSTREKGWGHILPPVFLNTPSHQRPLPPPVPIRYHPVLSDTIHYTLSDTIRYSIRYHGYVTPLGVCPGRPSAAQRARPGAVIIIPRYQVVIRM